VSQESKGSGRPTALQEATTPNCWPSTRGSESRELMGKPKKRRKNIESLEVLVVTN